MKDGRYWVYDPSFPSGRALHQVVVGRNGDRSVAEVSRILKPSIEAHPLLGPMEPWVPDGEIRTGELRKHAVPEALQAATSDVFFPNADEGALRYLINYWWEALGDDLLDLTLMGQRAHDFRIPSIPIDRKAYAIAVLVADTAPSVEAGSEFTMAHTTRVEVEKQASGLRQRFDFVIRRRSDVLNGRDIAPSLRRQIEEGRSFCRRAEDH